MVFSTSARNIGRVARTNFFEVIFRVKYFELLTSRSQESLLHPCRGATLWVAHCMFGNSRPILSIHRRCPRHKILISQPFCDRVTVFFTKTFITDRVTHHRKGFFLHDIFGFATYTGMPPPGMCVSIDTLQTYLIEYLVIAINVLQIFVERR